MDAAWSMTWKPSVPANTATMVPLIMNDDAQGDPMSFNANPEHASWAEVSMPMCYPDSEIRSFRLTVDAYIGKNGFVDDIKNSKFSYGLISCAFPEDLDAIDEKSGLSLKEIIEVQKETTDRQCYPLWNGTDVLAIASLLPVGVPGLTTTQELEHVNLLPNILKDQKRYGKLKGLIKKVMPIGWRTVNFNIAKNQHKRITINFVPSNAKFINPYTFLGIAIYCHDVDSFVNYDMDVHQPFRTGDVVTTDDPHMYFYLKCTYNERNPEFHMAKV